MKILLIHFNVKESSRNCEKPILGKAQTKLGGALPHHLSGWYRGLLFRRPRLCLVRVKAFSENIPFSGNAIFRKGKCFHAFGCISKKFPKNIFWCLEKKKEKINPEKHGQNLGKKSSTINAQLGLTTWCFVSSSPTTVPSIAIDGAILWRWGRDRRHDLVKHRANRNWRSASRDRDLGLRSSDWNSWDRRGLDLEVRRRSSDWIGARSSLSLSLSLSLSFRKYFEVKMKV